MDQVTNHEEAELYAAMHREDSNLARCYLDMKLQLDQTRKDRDSLIEERNKAVSDWQGKLLEATDIAKKALEDADELQKRIDAALKELGVPQPGYPAPVANAVDILTNGLKRICEHEWQDVEAVVHGADQCKKCFVLRQKPGLR